MDLISNSRLFMSSGIIIQFHIRSKLLSVPSQFPLEAVFIFEFMKTDLLIG